MPYTVIWPATSATFPPDVTLKFADCVPEPIVNTSNATSPTEVKTMSEPLVPFTESAFTSFSVVAPATVKSTEPPKSLAPARETTVAVRSELPVTASGPMPVMAPALDATRFPPMAVAPIVSAPPADTLRFPVTVPDTLRPLASSTRRLAALVMTSVLRSLPA